MKRRFLVMTAVSILAFVSVLPGGAVPPAHDHISEYTLNRTVAQDANPFCTRVTFEDAFYGTLVKNGNLPERYRGVAVLAGRYLYGDGSARTCADGEDRCAVCGELLRPAMAHSWGQGISIGDFRILYTCEICGCERTEIRTPILRSVVTLLNKLSGKEYKVYDLDGDGKVTAADARFVLRYSVGYGNYDRVIIGAKIDTADVDRDGKITTADARLYLRASVRMTTA